MRLYLKLALAMGVPFAVVLWVSGMASSTSAVVIGGVVFGVLMSAIIGTIQLRADRAADRVAAAQRRMRMVRREEERHGDQSKPIG